MPRSNRYARYLPVAIVAGVMAALMFAMSSSPARADIIDVEATDDEIDVGETTTIVVHTDVAGRSVTASLDATSEGSLAFVEADGSLVTEVEVVTTAFGYEETGTATLTVQGTAAGEATLLLTDVETGETLSASLTIGDVTPPEPDPAAGFSVEVPAGGVAITEFEGSVNEFRAVTGVHTCAMTVGGSFSTYVYGAPAFVNADFLANFDSPQMLICRGL